MSSSEQLSINYPNNESFTDLSSHKYNFFQQFFVIGLDPSISYNLNKIDIKHLPSELLTPKVISKYPNSSLPYLNIPDSFVASHCFPIGLLNKLIYYNDEELDEKSKIIEEFSFSLDNLAVQDYTSSLRTNKVYYNCLLFYEKLESFKNFANYRRKTSFKTQEILEEEKNKNILIPKVICLSSFKPVFMSGEDILYKIKRYCDNYDFNNLSKPGKDNFYPIEDIIEGIIFNIPGLPRGKFVIRLDYETFFSKDIIEIINKQNNNNKKLELKFKESPINQNPKAIINYSILLNFFTIEEIFDIIKSIILEEPILFFSEDISNLTHTIEGVLALIYPLTYHYPVVTSLPEENFSLINVFYHFIFGINYKYSEELWKNKFDFIGDKTKIIVIPIETRFPNFLSDIDKEKSINSIIITKTPNPQTPIVRLVKLDINKNKSKKENAEKKNIKLPIHYCSKCIKRLGPLIQTKMKEEKIKNKGILSDEIKDYICNKEIINNFLYFFTCILLNYQEYIKIKYEKIKNLNQSSEINETYKRPDDIEKKYLNNELKITDMFDIVRFINDAPGLDRPFYENFFKTKIFYDFIKKKIFPISVLDKIEVLFFDEKINEKLSREIKLKKIETKFLEDKIENISSDIRIESMKKEITDETREFLSNEHNCERGLNYFQYIVKQSEKPLEKIDEINKENKNLDESDEKKFPNFKFYYFVFPKLLNDGIFYQKRKKEINDRKRIRKFNSSCFYSVLESEGMKIINNPTMTANYKNYNYSLNPVNMNFPNHIKYKKTINQLWLRFLSKTFYCIPNNKKLYYFCQIIKFLKDNIKTIDEESLLILFHTINKYGDKNMNKEFFIQFSHRIKTYTSFLSLIEKNKEKNNFIDYRSCAEKNNKIEEKFLFIINSFCTNIDKDEKNKNLYNICGEENNLEIGWMFNEKEKYIRFECNKDVIAVKQDLIISCFYEKEVGKRYQINFRLISPAYILKQNWFKNVDNLDIDLLKKENLESYLSAIFYFHQQGLIFDFLTLKENPKRNLSIENNLINVNLNIKEIKIEKVEEQKEDEKKIEKKENIKDDIFMSANVGLDLGGLNLEFCEPPPEMEKRTKSPNKKKVKNTVTVAEFKLNIDDKK